MDNIVVSLETLEADLKALEIQEENIQRQIGQFETALKQAFVNKNATGGAIQLVKLQIERAKQVATPKVFAPVAE